MNKKTNEIVPLKSKFSILKTDADRYENDITLMSDFFSNYIGSMALSLKEENLLTNVDKFPIANINILKDVLSKNKTIITEENIILIPDFDKFDYEIKEKLNKGIYKLGDSKQVEGNVRAVIVDENNVRVKDVTLKSAKDSNKSKEIENNIATQQQLKQIYQKLIEIQEFQTFQNERDRDGKIIVPFLDARGKLLQAELSNDEKEIIRLLEQADEKIETAINHIYTDLKTTSEALCRSVNNPLGIFNPYRNHYMRWLISDLQISSKYIGARIQVLNYLGKNDVAQLEFQRYQNVLDGFFNKKILNSGMSASDLLQDYYPYGKNDQKDFWYNMTNQMRNITKKDIKELDNNKVYFISMEDNENV